MCTPDAVGISHPGLGKVTLGHFVKVKLKSISSVKIGRSMAPCEAFIIRLGNWQDVRGILLQ